MPRKSAEEIERALLCSRCHVRRWSTDIPVRLCPTCINPPTLQEPVKPAAKPWTENDKEENEPS